MVDKKIRFFALITLAIIILDQTLKLLIIRLQPHLDFYFGTIEFITNTGAGFGILPGWTFILGLISLGVTFGIILWYKKIPKKRLPQLLFALLLGGIMGNLVDRLFRGYVVDFIHLHFWPAFNLADGAISVSIIGIIIYFWKK